MARTADPRKSAAWQRRLQHFTISGMTVSRLCDREGVSVATFHSWRLKLRPQQLERVSRRTPSAFQPVDLLSAVLPIFSIGTQAFGISSPAAGFGSWSRMREHATAARPRLAGSCSDWRPD